MGFNFVVTDTDECLKEIHGCDVNAVCNNTLGSFSQLKKVNCQTN